MRINGIIFNILLYYQSREGVFNMLTKVFNYLQAGDFLLYIAAVIIMNFAVADEFNNEGPYGILYFDTAGPFTVTDINSSLSGDVNFDETVNIQDILLIVNIIVNG